MESIDYASVKRKIESEQCNIHKEHPKFEKTIDGFSISACCEKFRTKMKKKTETIMAEEIKTAIESMLKNTFR